MDIIGILVLVISFFFLLVVGVPVAYSIGVAGILTMLVNIDSLPALTTYAMRMASGLDSFALLAIPFFILAGNIMNSGGSRSCRIFPPVPTPPPCSAWTKTAPSTANTPSGPTAKSWPNSCTGCVRSRTACPCARSCAPARRTAAAGMI